MKRSYIRRKTPLKPSQTAYKGLRRTKLRVSGKDTTSQLKRDIQALVRSIVIARDGGCILRNLRHCDKVDDPEKIVLQADHLITRANSDTFADTRLIVCLCRPCHGGFKKWHKEQYDALVRQILPKERVELWDKCLKDSWNATRVTAYDWKLAKVQLEQEKKQYEH